MSANGVRHFLDLIDIPGDDLREWVRARLADYKIPDRVVAVREMPVTAVGKIDKRALAESGLTGGAPR